jgi:hypothetical protein
LAEILGEISSRALFESYASLVRPWQTATLLTEILFRKISAVLFDGFTEATGTSHAVKLSA